MSKVIVEPPIKCLRLVLVWLLGIVCSSSVFAQQIQIKLLNGRNGHSIKDCLSIWTSPAQRNPDPFMVRTEKNGIAVLNVSAQSTSPGHQIVAPCKAVPTTVDIAHAETIGIWADLQVDCRPRNEVGSSPTRTKFYSVDEILKTGIVTTNTCGKFKADPVPGELIFFVRHPHWWEALSR